jgi:flagellar assembly protein FliH
MANIRKYAFETEFAPDGAIVTQAPKKFDSSELEAEKAAAYKRGADDALAQAERQTTATVQALGEKVTALLSKLDNERRAMREEAARVAMMAARKIAGAALDSFGIERVALAIESVMDALRHQPRLVVKLAPEAVEKLKPRIDEMADLHGYAGAILVRAQPGVRVGEVSIDWSDGVIHMSPEDAAKRIEELIEAALAAPTTHS